MSTPKADDNEAPSRDESRERLLPIRGFGFDYYRTRLDAEAQLQILSESMHVGLKRPEINVVMSLFDDDTILFALETPRQRIVSHSSLRREYETASTGRTTAKLWTREENFGDRTIKHIGVQFIDKAEEILQKVDGLVGKVFPTEMPIRLYLSDFGEGYVDCTKDTLVSTARLINKH